MSSAVPRRARRVSVAPDHPDFSLQPDFSGRTLMRYRWDPSRPTTFQRTDSSTEMSIRASDAERNEVAERLSRHFAEGRLDQNEFNARLDKATRATTAGTCTGCSMICPGCPTRRPLGVQGSRGCCPCCSWSSLWRPSPLDHLGAPRALGVGGRDWDPALAPEHPIPPATPRGIGSSPLSLQLPQPTPGRGTRGRCTCPGVASLVSEREQPASVRAGEHQPDSCPWSDVAGADILSESDLAVTSMRRGLACSATGMRRVRTPPS